ncbi:unnamed protein product [Caenorhabditis angaria]|uniref:Trehalase n=1 Tax=Caenorhabditis angaria TaxID=860376 RepID=A0A9P1J1P5_9PELO|nr:unnamed protein product [Caenorhabditis angaria]
MCDGPLSSIYCNGDILYLSWQFGLQESCPGDKLKVNEAQVLFNFARLKYPIKREDFENFCNANFEKFDYLVPYPIVPKTGNLHYTNEINNMKHLKLAIEINKRWNDLSKVFNQKLLLQPHLFPVRVVQDPFIIPGGRFNVYFYWDSYWIIKGLARARLCESSTFIVKNFISLINQYGYVPNSGHIQLSRRSQPPMLLHMIEEQFASCQNIEYDWLEAAAKEMEFWETNRTIKIDNHTMFLYRTQTNCPRPESFLADYNKGISSTDPRKVWRGISSACESGWDFSSRWISDNSTNTIQADRIVPVDLNVIMAKNYYILFELYNLFEMFDFAEVYKNKYEVLSNSIHELMWNENENSWFDFNLDIESQSNKFYISNLFPLLLPSMQQHANKTVDLVKNITRFDGGIPISLTPSTEQWDYPNTWAPTQHLFIQSLRATNNLILLEIAKTQSLKFIETVYNGVFNPPKGQNGTIWEKYDARSSNGTPGKGGEYIVQEGFGWTNGAVIDLIWQVRDEFPKRIIPKPRNNSLKRNTRKPAPRIDQNSLLMQWFVISVFLFVICCILIDNFIIVCLNFLVTFFTIIIECINYLLRLCESDPEYDRF